MVIPRNINLIPLFIFVTINYATLSKKIPTCIESKLNTVIFKDNSN